MLYTIFEYTGFFITLIFIFGIIASIVVAVWDEMKASKATVLNKIFKKPGILEKLLKN